MNVRHVSPGDSPGIDRSLIQSLAREFAQTEDHVEELLLEEVGRIAAQARISTFVGVLATSSVRNRLRHEAATSH